ncbi:MULTISPECIES: aspartate/glutamate racemase family protein [unclassified Pseudomonas]|uniref:aspartate/glutamate racemase family protein n=1 Tax=unclassified Pseudomonas TaxID=196821 RepID=UPI00131B649B|nr:MULTISPECIES: aspartate/glutamate racemase family protein [unclassified Pseudomonas]
MFDPILVINPNRNAAVTQGIDQAIDRFRLPGGPSIHCLTLLDGPDAVQSQSDIASVTGLLDALAQQHDDAASAFVIACFSDPGLALLRERCATPVLGIGESAILQALEQGERFGVIAMSDAARSRHLRSYAAMGVSTRFAGECALALSMEALQDQATTQARLLDVGATLIATHQADVLILGCAGLASYRAVLQRELDVPVIDPCQAAVARALGHACLNRKNS